MKSFETASEEDTAAIAHEIAADAAPGQIFCLRGDLGMGKTVFARAFIRALCGEDTEVPSPTFTLVQTYESGKGDIWHFDLYRIEDAEEVYELGWEEALSRCITLIEWPERIEGLLPPVRTEIVFTPGGGESRKIAVDNHE